MKKHERKHTAKEPYSCKECGQSFFQAFNLQTHEIKHTGEKHYSCKECGKSYAQNCNLKGHARISPTVVRNVVILLFKMAI